MRNLTRIRERVYLLDDDLRTLTKVNKSIEIESDDTIYRPYLVVELDDEDYGENTVKYMAIELDPRALEVLESKSLENKVKAINDIDDDILYISIRNKYFNVHLLSDSLIAEDGLQFYTEQDLLDFDYRNEEVWDSGCNTYNVSLLRVGSKAFNIDFFSKNTDDVITGTFYYEDIAKILNNL